MTLTARQPKLPYPSGTIRVECGPRSAWLYGPGVKRALDATQTPHMRCPIRKTFTVPLDRLADVLAYLEHGSRCHHIELVELSR